MAFKQQQQQQAYDEKQVREDSLRRRQMPIAPPGTSGTGTGSNTWPAITSDMKIIQGNELSV